MKNKKIKVLPSLEEVIEKYTSTIYDRFGQVRPATVYKIAKDSGIDSSLVWVDSLDILWINYKMLDPAGNSRKEVQQIYNACRRAVNEIFQEQEEEKERDIYTKVLNKLK